MGITKTDVFTDEQNQLANLFKAIGHPARVAILNFLLQQESCICKDIVAELPLSQPTISQHLKALKEGGLIQGNIEGNTICYCLNPAGFEQVLQYISSVMKTLNLSNFNTCKTP